MSGGCQACGLSAWAMAESCQGLTDRNAVGLAEAGLCWTSTPGGQDLAQCWVRGHMQDNGGNFLSAALSCSNLFQPPL